MTPQVGPELSARDTKVFGAADPQIWRRECGCRRESSSARASARASVAQTLPYYERMHLTEWLEERAEEYRQKGSTAPYKDAERYMYQMRYGNNEPRKGRTIKKLRQQGRRDWIEFLEKMLNHPLYKGQQDLRKSSAL